MTRRHRDQRGQSLVLAALLITALTGFVGLAVDGGEAANEQQIVRSAADGAALAGLYAIANGSATTAATTLAQQVLIAVPLPIADLTMSYLDAGGSPTIVTANVVTVRAVVADTHTTFFLRALGVPNLLLTATAEAKRGGSGGAAAACAVCLMGATGTTLSERNSASMTITGGPLNVNSNGVSAIDQDNGAALTAPSITVVGGVLKGTGTITPSPVTSSAAILDPFAAIPVPALVGAAANFTAPAGTSALAPGVYSTVTVNAGSTLTFSPGTFVILTELNVNRGAVNGGGVTLYLGCAAYPTPCAVGASGAFINVASGSLTLAPPAAGTYAGLTVFADRNNIATDTFAGSAVTVTGTWYSVLEPLVDATNADSISFGQLVIASISMPNASIFTANRSATTSYGTGAATIGLTL
ncbi:MAG TPA: pilus assembly protein TadG-related protein [Candidatus Dormibacteraeota bacterium]